MKRKKLFAGILLLAAFAAWTAAVCTIDVRPIGPLGSSVGLASVNGFLRDRIGVRMSWYVLTDLLSLIPLGTAAGFALLGLTQWIRRKHPANVDRSILLLGGFYVITAAAYLLFELLPVNFRPVLIDGALEASYPSSTTMLVLCVMSFAAVQLRIRIQNPSLRRCAVLAIAVFSALMVMGRLFSGVHWFSDIIGGILLSAGLAALYAAAVE